MNKILIVEDELITRETLAKSLERRGYEALRAENGKVAWDILISTPEIDCMVMDIAMPVMDGRELVTIMRRHDTLKLLPVIIVSGVFKFEDVEELLLMSPELTFFMSKPINMPVLIKYLSKLDDQRTEQRGVWSLHLTPHS